MSKDGTPIVGFWAGLGADARALGTRKAWGFTPHEYWDMIKQYPTLLRERPLKVKDVAQMEREAHGKAALKRTLGPFGLTCVGVGLMLGAGIFIAPGQIAVELTGPAVCLSYLVAALSAFLSCFCYCEFSVDMPLAGAAYNYMAGTVGEFLAWIVTSNMLFEYILADASVIRSFSPYFAVLLNKDSSFFQYQTTIGGNTFTVDWMAFGLTLLLTAINARGAKESTTVNNILTVVHVLLMAFIIIAGFTKADTANFQPFFPHDQPDAWKHVFNGAAIAFFSFIGFDAVATAAEEVVDPARVMPLGILASLSTVTVIYVLMCVVLCLMVPRAAIDTKATFAAAFEYVGLPWAKYIVALGALMGIITGTMVGIYAPARMMASSTREGLLPPVLSWVGPRQTPWVATWLVGICVAVIALLTDFAALSNMVSIGTFVVFWFVALSLLWRRLHVPGSSTPGRLANTLLHLAAMVGFSLGFVLVWTLPVYNTVDGVRGAWADHQWKLLVAMVACCAAVPVSMFFFCKPAYVPAGFQVPLFPFVPCASLFVNTFLLGQLNQESYLRFGWWTLAVAGVYFLYGIFASQSKDERVAAEEAVEAEGRLEAGQQYAKGSNGAGGSSVSGGSDGGSSSGADSGGLPASCPSATATVELVLVDAGKSIQA